MGFLLQLKLLLWKNFLQRRRNWVRLLLEIVYPLLLFIILVAVRSRDLKLYYHDCYFDEKAMPSAGFLKFTQSFFCTFNNTCYDHEQKDYNIFRSYNDSFLTQLFNDVNVVFGEHVGPRQSDSLATALLDLVSLTTTWKDLGAKLSSGVQGVTVSPLKSLLIRPDEFQQNFSQWTATRDIVFQPDYMVDVILNSTLSLGTVVPYQWMAMLSNPEIGLCDPKVVSQVFQVHSENVTQVDVQSFLQPLCDLNMTDGKSLASLIMQHLDTEQLKKQMDEVVVATGGSEIQWDDWKEAGRVALQLRNSLIQTRSVRKVMSDLSNIIRLLMNRSEVLRSESGHLNMSQAETESLISFAELKAIKLATDAYAKLQQLICGRKIPPENLPSLFGSGADSLETFREKFKLVDKDNTTMSKYVYDNSTSAECNRLFMELEANSFTKILWRLIKPYVRGKILFTPDTPATRNLMHMINSSFDSVAQLRTWSHYYLQNRQLIEGFLMDSDNQDFIKTLFVSTEAESVLDMILRDEFVQTLNQSGPQPLLSEQDLRQSLDQYFRTNYSSRWNDSLSILANIASNISFYTSCFEFDKFVGVPTETELEIEGMKLVGQNKLWAGIVFSNLPTDKKARNLPPYVKYKIRMDADTVDSTGAVEDRINRPGPRARRGIDLKYFYYGFAYLQDRLEHAIIAEQTGRNVSDLPGISLQQFPYPCYIDDRFIMAISRTFPMFMTLAWVYACSMIIKSIVYEKEKRLKETMKVMGLGNGVHWVAWFIDSFAAMIFSVFLLTLILKYGKVLTYSDPSVIFAFMSSYAVATICLSFFLSTLFSKANIAAAAGGIIFFCLYLPYTLMLVWEAKVSTLIRILTSLISNVAFGFGCAYFSYYEEEAVGAQWSNIWISPQLSTGDTYSLAGCIGMLWIDSVFYSLLAWYIEAVFPGEFGVRKPWYFFVTLSYWTGQESKVTPVDKNFQGDSDFELGESHPECSKSKELSHLKLGVSVQHLHKIYSNGKVAIEDLSLDFYEGQITSFLGHNGAGKTTTISILTGMFPPTAGTAKINGLDIRTSMDIIRQSVGFCPQHNVLFENLTVFEHLWFYARLKGRQPDDIYQEADRMIQDLGLPHKRHEFAKKLSGGMKRKLSIASAFVGGSRVVVLDEPTAGVDPYSRRSIWDLLITYKKGRTIIMSTHFMDEADLLGDRIAIINNGRLVCVGSSLYLRAKFGNGFYLTLVRDSGVCDETQTLSACSSGSDHTDADKDTVASDEAVVEDVGSVLQAHSSRPQTNELDLMIDDEGISDVAKKNGFVINPSKAYEQAMIYPITKFVTKYIKNARLLDHFGRELTYILPAENRKAGLENFASLFEALDLHMDKLQIRSYGLSDTTLEEIFLKVAGNIHDNSGMRQIMYDDVTDGGRYAARVRSASTRSIEARHIFLPEDQSKVLGMNCNNAEEEYDDPAAVTESRQIQVTTDAGRTVTYTKLSSVEETSFEKPKVKRNCAAPPSELTSQALFVKHLMALEVRRFHHARRNKKGFICEILLPAAFVCLAMVFTLIVPPLENEQPLELHPWLYPTWGQDYPTETFVSNHHYKLDWANRYSQQLLSETSMGTRCLESSPIPNLEPCRQTPANVDQFFTPDWVLGNMTYHECTCSIGTQQCPAQAYGPDPPRTQLASYDIIANLTGRNISDFLIKTTKEYSKRRYGGFEFGVGNYFAHLNLTVVQQFLFTLFNTTGLHKKVLRGFGDAELMASLGSSMLEEMVFTSPKLDNIRVWFNNKGWAASMAYMNAANNLVLRASLLAKQEDFDSDWSKGHEDPSKFGIAVVNHPMNYTNDQMSRESIRQIATGLLHAICIIFALSFVPASFVVFLIDERVSDMKHLQFVSSVRPLTYWLSSILWDLSMYMITTIICILIFIVFNAQAYISEDSLPALFALLFLFGWATIPLMYPSSFVFRVPSSAFVTLSCLNLFIGIITTITVFVLENFDDDELKLVGKTLKEVFLIFPQYCLGRGLLEMAVDYNQNLVASKFGFESVRKNRFALDFLGKYMLCLLLQGIIFFLFTLMLETKSLKPLWRNRFTNRILTVDQLDSASTAEEDADVAEERCRIGSKKHSSSSEDVVLVRDMIKRYGSSPKPAVNRLTFGVKRGECFGLLGVNGAGKTSTFKMLTGDIEPSSGTAFIDKFDIRTQLSQARRNLGYCPQFDALNPLLTGREHLTLFARLRGLSEKAVALYTEWGLKKLGLTAYADRCAGTYSGGNKRKLSTAIALIGNPAVVFLDEPTTGMDPAARRLLWNCILDMIRGGQSVILTSHSMEECEALCTRLAIMVNGRFECLGSIQHLKNRFGSGYTLTVRCSTVQPEQLQRLRHLVQTHFPEAQLKEEHVSQMQFHLPLNSTKLKHVFMIMENARSQADLCLEDYSLSQLTLDEVFVQFASRQSETLHPEQSQQPQHEAGLATA